MNAIRTQQRTKRGDTVTTLVDEHGLTHIILEAPELEAARKSAMKAAVERRLKA